MKQNRAFTLIEICIVLAIVMLLASLVFTVFVRVREKGRNTTCQSNLQQLALAMQQYRQDNDGRFPAQLSVPHAGARIVAWYDVILLYLKDKTVFQCPSKPSNTVPSYGYHWTELNDIPQSTTTFRDITGSHESKFLTPSEIYLNLDKTTEGPSKTPCGLIRLSLVHSSGANFSFLDGHVKWQSVAQQQELSCAFRSRIGK